MRRLWTLSNLERVRKCRRVQTGAYVGVARTAAGAAYSNLSTCSSVWVCPRCSRQIMAGRAEEVGTALTGAHREGLEVGMVTLTMRHDRTQPLTVLWDALQAAWAAARGGHRSSRDAMAQAGVQGWIRNVEATHGINGWHVHAHVLVFLPGGTTGADLELLGRAMFGAWRKRLSTYRHPEHDVAIKAPAIIPDPDTGQATGGLHTRMLDLTQPAKAVADYVAKGLYSADEAASQVNRAAGELASSGYKNARGGNRSPFAILAAIVAKPGARDVELWHEWEEGSAGRKQLHWSRGLKAKYLGLDCERDDAELAADAALEDRELVGGMRPNTWKGVVAIVGGPETILDLVDAAIDRDDARRMVDAQLRSWGLLRLIPPEGCAKLDPPARA